MRFGAAIVFVVTVLLCAPWVFFFEARATDLSALRVLHGEVPYRDFWTMYAPGSFLLLSAVFRVLGEELVWSNLLGVLTTAATVAAFYRLVARASSPTNGMVAACVFACAFIQSGFHDGFTTYPPAILCVILAFGRMTAFAERSRWRDLVLAGLCLGLGACFKHDVAAYGAVACALSSLFGGAGTRAARMAAVLVPAVIPVAALSAWLGVAGAGPDAWQDLVMFPATDFRHVRPESFPIWPPFQSALSGWRPEALYRVAREVSGWLVLHLPTLALLAGLVGAWRRRATATPGGRALVVIAAVAYPLFWFAAHVQINTHKVTLAALGLAVSAVGLVGSPRVFAGLCVVWTIALAIEPFEVLRQRLREGLEPLGLPHTRAIWVTHGEATWMRGLHRAMADAAPPEAPLLFAGRRNDVLIFADSTPFWLTERRPATRHHELHPGITDTEKVQQRMIADLSRSSDPVVVREHRFRDKGLDQWSAAFQSHGVPVGSRLLDAWIAERYPRGTRFGRYEVLERAK